MPPRQTSPRGPTPHSESVDDYLAAQPPHARRALRLVRSAIRRALPGATESISYRIPTYKLGGRPVIYFAGWCEHYSIYPCTSRVVAALEAELAPYDVSKGTIRFPWTQPVPVALIAGIAALRAGETAARKAAPPRRRR